MLHRFLPPAILALSVPAAMVVGELPALGQVGSGQRGARIIGQVTIHERIVIRVPRSVAPYSPSPPPTGWRERKGPKCLATGDIAAAAIAAPAAVDLLLIDGRRVRARLDRECRSADFYSGLYIRPGADGRICADRDAIRVRSGAACAIDDFRLLRGR